MGEKYKRKLPFNKAGESWDIACGKNGMSIIKNGMYAGRRLIDVISANKRGVLGEKLYSNPTFPLLVKLIDAGENLSVQVHPNAKYARKFENSEIGKNEVWYVLDAPKGAYLILGFNRKITKNDCRSYIQNGTFEYVLGKRYIKKHDVIYIPSGLIHSLTAGVTVLEIQQNCDITYRIYDYLRKGFDENYRELHIQKAIEVIDFENNVNAHTIEGTTVYRGNSKITHYVSNEYFAIEKYDVSDSITENSNLKFSIFTCVSGECIISSKEAAVKLAECDSTFIPANTGEYKITGQCGLIKSYVP